MSYAFPLPERTSPEPHANTHPKSPTTARAPPSPPSPGDKQRTNSEPADIDPSSSTVPAPTSPPPSPFTAPNEWLTYPVSYAVSSLYRRVSAPPDPRLTGLLQAPGASQPRLPSIPRYAANAASSMFSRSRSRSRQVTPSGSTVSQEPPPPLPPGRASPFQPPPLTPLKLKGVEPGTPASARILSRTLAEEIRLLLPPRLQLDAMWKLVYSVEQDGASLATLYSKCDHLGDSGGSSLSSSASSTSSGRSGFVVVVRDAVGGIFGAFLTDPPRPRSSYYGTGECFLWSASVQTVEKLLSHLPPPPSEDTTHLEGRSTTLVSPTRERFGETSGGRNGANGGLGNGHLALWPVEEEERIRFRAYPYSGINNYMIYCEQGYMSVGGGDGRYGLWLDDNLEKGISSPSLTFGNEALSEEGEKFEALGVEVWFIGG